MSDLLSILAMLIIIVAFFTVPTPKWLIKLENKFDKFFEKQRNIEVGDVEKAIKELDSLNKFSKKAPD